MPGAACAFQRMDRACPVRQPAGKPISGTEAILKSIGWPLLVTQCTRSGHIAMPPFSPASRLSSARSSSPRSRSRLK